MTVEALGAARAAPGRQATHRTDLRGECRCGGAGIGADHPARVRPCSDRRRRTAPGPVRHPVRTQGSAPAGQAGGGSRSTRTAPLPKEQVQQDRRFFRMRPTKDGAYAGEFRLTSDCGTELLNLLHPLAKPRINSTPPMTGSGSRNPTPASHGQRMHDALADVCGRLLRSVFLPPPQLPQPRLAAPDQRPRCSRVDPALVHRPNQNPHDQKGASEASTSPSGELR